MQTTLSKKLNVLIIFVLLAGMVWRPAPALSAEGDSPGSSEIRKPAEAFRFDLRVLSYGIIQQPSDSSQNPGNNFLQIPRYTGNLEFRPDLALKTDSLDLMAKPRLRLEYREWEEGSREGRGDWESDLYVNEWLARWKANENLFVSYGRENLQWGPSFLFSPSNPFFPDNGRRNPYEEVPGMDFGRVIWIPDSAWTVSFIANTDEGRNDINLPGPFERAYALKMDYQGREGYGSVILTHRENSENSLGFYGGVTLSDAVLVYAEGAMIRHDYALYPRRDGSPFGASMERIHADDSTVQPAILLGSSYTFAEGGTFTGEYAYYGPGYSGAEADRYYVLRRKAAEALAYGGPISGLGRLTLWQTVNTGLRHLRRNYALLQYNRNNIEDCIDLTFRWTQNLDDWSGQLTALGSYILGNHIQLFAVGTVNGGRGDTEFGGLLDYQCMMGLQYTF
ncbi:MAG: hypothetical protein WAL98_14190 [Desulfatiglandaceae bacterium]